MVLTFDWMILTYFKWICFSFAFVVSIVIFFYQGFLLSSLAASCLVQNGPRGGFTGKQATEAKAFSLSKNPFKNTATFQLI